MTQLTGLHAKFTGDASGISGAAQQAIGLIDQYGRAVVKVRSAEEQAAAASAKLATEFHKLKMETDNAYAGMQRYQKAADLTVKIAREQKWSVEQLQTELARLATHYGVAEQAGMSLNQQVRASRFHTANLAAQFNDIGVMMASGQSPFILAIQQGTQVSQVLDNLGGTGKAKLLALKDALLSVISPSSLLTIALIAGAAAFYQWVTSAGEADKKAEEFQNKLQALKNDVISTQAEIAKFKFGEDDTNTVALLLEQEAINKRLVALQVELTTASGNRLYFLLREQQELINRQGLVAAALAEEEAVEIELAKLRKDKKLADEWANKAKEQLLAKKRAEKTLVEQIHKAMIAQQAAHAAILRQTSANKQMLGEAWKAVLNLNTGLWEGSRAAAALTASGPAGGWLSGAISDAITLANTLWDAAAAASAVRGGNIISKIGSGFGGLLNATFGGLNPSKIDSSQRPQQRPIDWVPNEGTGSGGGGGGGGGGGENPLIAELEQFKESLLTVEELEAQSYAKRQEMLKNAWEQRLITEKDYQSMMEQVNKTHQFNALKNMNDHTRDTLSSLSTLFQGSKKIGAGIALANSWLAFTEVLKDPAYTGRPFARFAAAAAALSSGFNAVRNIKSAGEGGTGGGSNAGTGGGASGGQSAPPIQNVRVSWDGPESSFNSVSALFDIFNAAAKNGYRLNTQLVRGNA